MPYYSDDAVTLYHGDCREVTAWLAADVLVTDPPYGMRYVSGGSRSRNRGRSPIAGDGDLELRTFALGAWGPDRPALVFGTWKRPRPEAARMLLIWDKRGGQGYSGDTAFPWGEVAEEVYVMGEGWAGTRRGNIYSVPSLNSQALARPDHPTPKPLSLMQLLIQECPPGVVSDPFAGSGATLLAAKMLGRKAVGVEIEERYCEVIANRLCQDVLDFGGAA